MSEIMNCCGTTCDKAKVKAEIAELVMINSQLRDILDNIVNASETSRLLLMCEIDNARLTLEKMPR